MSDSSPQGRRDWFITRFEIWDRRIGVLILKFAAGDPEVYTIAVVHLLADKRIVVPVVLGSGRTNLAHKFNALLHQLKLEFGASVLFFCSCRTSSRNDANISPE
jgi:hypothetical protein